MPEGRAATAQLALRVLRAYLQVLLVLPRHPFPEVVDRLATAPQAPGPAVPIRRLSWMVDRTLHVGSLRPRCLVNALVLFRLLQSQGVRADVVIGLPPVARDKDAHAWVEVDGHDVGPAPGRSGHEEFARFGPRLRPTAGAEG